MVETVGDWLHVADVHPPGLHAYVYPEPPDAHADNVVELPAQIVPGDAEALAVGNGFTVTVTEAVGVPVQPITETETL